MQKKRSRQCFLSRHFLKILSDQLTKENEKFFYNHLEDNNHKIEIRVGKDFVDVIKRDLHLGSER